MTDAQRDALLIATSACVLRLIEIANHNSDVHGLRSSVDFRMTSRYASELRAQLLQVEGDL